MIRIDPNTGCFQLEGIDEPLEPRMSYSAFCAHAAFAVMPEDVFRRASNHHTHDFPEGHFGDFRVRGSASFTNGELEALWLQVLPEDADGKLLRHDDEDPKLLELQERWLLEVVGVESRDYPWGLVWNRYNIDAGWHDIAVFFNRR
jgi:hypothetical protein